MRRLFTQRHRGFWTAIVAAIVVALAAAVLAPGVAFVVTVNAFFLAYLILVATVSLPKLTPDFLRRHAADEDAPALLIFGVMVIAVVASVVSLFNVVAGGAPALQIGLSVASVILGWGAVHMMWAFHYAYEYYGAPQAKAGKADGGLSFPGREDPDGTAFLYFSYVVGMTAQTSDTAVTTNAMRRIVAVHGAFSFFFNTVILAAAVNIAVTVGR